MSRAVCPPVLVMVTCTVGIGKVGAGLEGKFAGDGLIVRLAGAAGPAGRHPALMSRQQSRPEPCRPAASAVPAWFPLGGVPIVVTEISDGWVSAARASILEPAPLPS